MTVEEKEKKKNNEEEKSSAADMDSSTKAFSERRFLFDLNNFDDEEEYGPDGRKKDSPASEDLPPPPTFSQADLESASNSAYQKGREDGISEAKSAREEIVSNLLASLLQNLELFHAQEKERGALYEREALKLSAALFKILFPALNARHGFAELQSCLSDVLADPLQQQQIRIALHPDYTKDIETLTSTLPATIGAIPDLDIHGNPDLGPGDIEISWSDGGMIRHADDLAEEILKRLCEIGGFGLDDLEKKPQPPEDAERDLAFTDDSPQNEDTAATDDNKSTPSENQIEPGELKDE